MATNQPEPSKIIQTAMGFWPAKVLLTAVSMELFTQLADNDLSGTELKEKLNLHERGFYDFLDALVALGFLNRTGIKQTARYSNTEETGLYLNKNKTTYIGGIIEMADNRLYPYWNNLEEALKTGLPQNELKSGGNSIFDTVYSDEQKLREFLQGISSIQSRNFKVFSEQFDFSGYKTMCDIGGAGGHLAVAVAVNNSHMTCATFDLPPVAPIAAENISRIGAGRKINILSGDFFEEELPQADVLTMGNILHDWGLADKKMLIKKAFDALPQKGSLVVIENIIDNDRNKNAFGLMASLNMLIETREGFDYSAADFEIWAKEIGFEKITVMPLIGPSSAIIAVK